MLKSDSLRTLAKASAKHKPKEHLEKRLALGRKLASGMSSASLNYRVKLDAKIYS